MKYTQNYQLPLWDKEDAVLRTDFNENNQKIDAALSTVGPKFYIGSYTGTGTYGSENPNRLEFSFQPKLVMVISNTGNSKVGRLFLIQGSTATTGMCYAPTSGCVVYPNLTVTWEGNAVSWYLNTYGSEDLTRYAQCNAPDVIYTYIAIG